MLGQIGSDLTRTETTVSRSASSRTQKLLSWRFWAETLLTILVVLAMSSTAERNHWFLRERYRASQLLDQMTSARVPAPTDVRLVLIDEAEFRGERLGGRLPIKGDYLADLLRALDRINVAVIAVDFANLNSYVDAETGAVHPQYLEEVATLLRSIKEIAQRRTIVLPLVITEVDGQKRIVKDIFDPLRHDGTPVVFGHIMRPADLRAVPIGLEIDGHGFIDSFSMAIARARHPHLAPVDKSEERMMSTVIYAQNLIPYEIFRTSFSVAASDVVAGEAAGLSHNIAVVGGFWRQHPRADAKVVDVLGSPIGEIPGVVMHANFVEALLDQRYAEPISHLTHLKLDVGFALALALAMRLFGGGFMSNAGVVAMSLLAVVGAAVMTSAHLGYFIEWFALAGALLLHAVLEEWRHGRAASRSQSGD